MHALETNRTADVMLSFGAAFAGVAPIILAIEAVEWFVTGHWPGWSIEDGLLFVGVEKPLAYFNLTQFALDLLTDLPLALGLYLLGHLLFTLALRIDP
ncbi:MAG: hypothetical protein ACK4K7_09070 [Allosphingosinicella sp.]|uniref:hypothetical protein n=1 Tax=Allosphingosinicella sp. TaxID=2823234 RepID=UPI0039232E21